MKRDFANIRAITDFFRRTHVNYLTARIARDRPDILKRMEAGEFRSVRQAAIAAGILDLWLACKTHDEISHIIGKDRSGVTRIVQNFKDEQMHILSETPPESLKMFNLWNFADVGTTLDASLEVQNELTSVWVDGEWKLGEMLSEILDGRRGRNPKESVEAVDTFSLPDYGITRDRSSRNQNLVKGFGSRAELEAFKQKQLEKENTQLTLSAYVREALMRLRPAVAMKKPVLARHSECSHKGLFSRTGQPL